MPQDRKRRLAVNSMFSLLSWVSPLVLSFLTTPLILRKLGNEGYGIYVVVVGFISYSFTFGIGRAVAKYVAEFRASDGDATEKITDAVSCAFWLTLFLGTLGAVIIAVAARPIVTDVLQISIASREAAIYALVLGGISIPITMLGQVFQNILQGVHAFGRLSLLTNSYWILINIGNVLLVISGFGVTALMAWSLGVSSVLVPVYWMVARERLPAVRVGTNISREMLRTVFYYGASIFSFQVFANILLIFERGWITRRFGAASTPYYLVPMTLAIYMHGFIASCAAAVFPALNELLNDRSRLLDLYRKSTKVVFALTVYFATSVISGGDLFFGLWIDPEFAGNAYPLLVVHTLTFGLIAIMIITWQIHETFNAARLNALSTLVWAAIGIPLMISTVDAWGIEGVALSRLAGVIVTIPAILYAEHRFLGSIHWRFWGDLILKVGLAAGVLAVTERFIFVRAGVSWTVFVIGNVLGTIVFWLILYLLRFVDRDEGLMIRNMLRGEAEIIQ